MNIERRARSNELEVEDIIQALESRDIAVAECLEALSEKYGWVEAGKNSKSGEIPFGTWVRVGALYARGGYDALIETSVNTNGVTPDLKFALAFIESYKVSKSVAALAKIVVLGQKHWTPVHRANVASAINLLLSFKNAPKIADEDKICLREFLHDTLRETLTVEQRATVFCALRGVADASSLKLLDAAPELPYPWNDTLAAVRKAISKQVRKK